MTKRHTYRGINQRANCALHPSPPLAVAHYNDVDTENGTGGGSWVSPVTMFGKGSWIKQTIGAAGNGHLQRADLIVQDSPWGGYTDENGIKGITALSRGLKNETTVYRHQFYADPITGEYKPVSGTNWNAMLAEAHSSFGGWPGSSGPSYNYLGNIHDFVKYTDWGGGSSFPAPFHGDAWQEGDIYLILFGGNYAANEINNENRVFLPKGSWEQKVIDYCAKTHWNDNAGQPGSYFWNRHAPADLANSGWTEIQYRLGTPVRNIDGSINFNVEPIWGPWLVYNPKFSAGGLNLDWQNGPEFARHYCPTLALNERSYLKWPNYRGDEGPGVRIPSSLYYSDVEWGDTYTDMDVPEIGAVSDVTAPTLASAAVDGVNVTLTFNESFDPTSIPAIAVFNVKANGNLKTIDARSVTGAVVSLTLHATTLSTDTVTFDYNKPPTNPLRDAAGNQVANIAGAAVTNNTAPVITPGTTFQLGKTNVGAGWVGNEPGYKRVSPYPWPADNPDAIQILDARGYIRGQTTHADSGPDRFLVHASDGSGGGPGKLLGYSDDLTIFGDQAPAWLAFAGANLIGKIIKRSDVGGGGVLWMGEHYNGLSNMIATAKDNVVGAQVLRTDSFAGGASDPWSASEGGGVYDGTYDNQFSFYIVYQVVSAGPAPIVRTAAARVISAISRKVGGIRVAGQGGSI